MTTISGLATKVEQMIADVQNGLPTQYTTYHDEATEKTWKIRVANHDANPDRVDTNTISFIVPANEVVKSDDDSYSPMHLNKKSFASVPQQYYIVDGCDEYGYSIEELLTYNID